MAMTTETEDARYERARLDAARLRGFYVHVLAFVLGNAANFVINWITRQNGGN
jgi:hypothetical protein